MKRSPFKTVFLIGMCSLFLASCSSKPTTTSASDAGTGVSNGGVATGSLSGDGVRGTTLDTSGGIDTVFYFEFDRAVLKPEALAALRIHAQRLMANPVNVRIEGHADERGTREYNMALGERRGAAVKEFLTLQGVSGNILEVISYGEESPAMMGSSEGDMALNRRVEMK